MGGGTQGTGRGADDEELPGIAGFGAAEEVAAADGAAGRGGEVAEQRDLLETALADAAKLTIFVGKAAPRLPNTSCIITPGWKGETQVMQMDLAGFAISAGSACSSGKVRASAVLRAMGFGEKPAASASRGSAGCGGGSGTTSRARRRRCSRPSAGGPAQWRGSARAPAERKMYQSCRLVAPARVRR